MTAGRVRRFGLFAGASVLFLAGCTATATPGSAIRPSPTGPVGSDLPTMVWDTPEEVSEFLDMGPPIWGLTTDRLCAAVPVAALSQLFVIDLSAEVRTDRDPRMVACSIETLSESNTRISVNVQLRAYDSERDAKSRDSPADAPGTTKTLAKRSIAGFPGYLVLTEYPDPEMSAGVNILDVGIGVSDTTIVEMSVVTDNDIDTAGVVSIAETLVRNLLQ